MRENLIDRMIQLYGYESPIVIQFAQMCEDWEDTSWNNKALSILVKCHEETPVREP